MKNKIEILIEGVLSESSNSDEEYLDAVKKGDMESTKQMVEDTAKNAGYSSQILFHKTSSTQPINEFHGIVYLTPDPSFTGINTKAIGLMGLVINCNNIYDGYEAASDEIKELYSPLVSKGRLVRPLDFGYMSISDEDYDRLITAWQDGDFAETENRIEKIKSLGYDSFIVRENGTENIGVFNSNQIKSADPVTYDDTGNPIPLSMRFNPQVSDIRY